MARSSILFLLALCSAYVAKAQMERMHIQGAATPYALSSDYRALGHNPALMTFDGWEGDYTRTTGGFEGGLSIRSTFLERTDLWSQLRGNTESESAQWAFDDWVDALTNEDLHMSASFLSAAYARRMGTWAFAYANRRSVLASINLSSTAAKLFSDGGLDLFSSIRLVDSGEIVPVEEFDFTLGQVWEGVELNTEATLANLLQGSTFSFQSVRSHEMGLSKSWGAQDDGGWELHTGIGARLILGSAYFDLEAEGNDLKAFGARSEGLSWSSIQAFDSLRGSGLSLGWLDIFSPAGRGWSVDFGGVLSRDNIWVGASLVDVGRMTWQGKEYGIQNLSLGLAPDASNPEVFDPTQFSIDPGSWLSSASDLLNPESWFESGLDVERVVRAKPMLALSAGLRPIRPLVLAANVSVRNRDAIARGGWTGGATAGVRLTSVMVLEAGVHRGHHDVFRFPMSFRFSMRRGLEFGVRTSDVSVLWTGAQPELGFQGCFLRYRMVQSGD